ncbi:hypothetical protein MKEN_00740400 [Mycena kentingensis (nom. inval.)]|nr:hypothetical protein MKEN_00740400 [Mycena kentingensis (nom. inval.)]
MSSRECPPEILALICDNLTERAALFSLCRTSRVLLDNAQRILYRSVDLEGLPIGRVRSWLLAVGQHEHLAESVRSLTLQLPQALDLAPKDANAVAAAFKACTNLKELRLLCMPNAEPNKGTHEWMVDRCTFRLTTFVNSYFAWTPMLSKFLSAQSQIRVLSVPGCGSIPGHLIAGDAGETPKLPALVAVSTNIESLPANRPLERIETLYFVTKIERLRDYGQTLTTLNLFIWGSFIDVTITVNQMADLCPLLEHLALVETDYGMQVLGGTQEGTPMASVIPKLARLETFTYIQRNEVLGTSVAQPSQACTPEDLRRIVKESVEASPKMRRFVLGTTDYCLYTARKKEEGGQVDVEAHQYDDEIDFEPLSMFYV